jgi:endoglucanase
MSAGYSSAPAALTITIANYGVVPTGALTITLTGTNASSFTSSHTSFGSGAAVGEERTFTVRPNTGLTAGTYTATVSVTATGMAARTVSLSFTVTPAGQGPNLQTLTAKQLVASMGVGINLGNTFDAVGDADNGLFSYINGGTMTASNIINIETAWLGGTSAQTTQNFIKEVKKQGFDTIRIPVTWWKATGAKKSTLSSNTYQINADWMKRVKQVVDWAIAENLYVILNTHHEEDVMRMDAGNRANAVKFVETIWKQIAATFNDGYDHRLIFEGLN